MWNFSRFAADFFNSGLIDSYEENDSGLVPFQEDYKCYSVTFLARDEMERGNKILLPSSALVTLSRMNVTWPMIFSLANPTLDRVTHGGVLEFTAEEGCCYLPYWVMKNLLLGEGDMITVSNTTLPKGTYVKIQPVTSDFLDIYDHREVLERALSLFSCLTTGDNIEIHHQNKTFEIEIVECQPSPAISIIETDVQVDFLAPKDYVEPIRQTEGLEKKLKRKKEEELVPQTNPQSTSSLNFGQILTSSNLTQNTLSDTCTPKQTGTLSCEKTPQRIPKGIRTKCKEYSKYIQSSSFLSKTGNHSSNSSSSIENKSSQPSTNFSLFSGEGRQC
ncbi:ubiquitin recognition factor in ER-associated degradation protein 1-like isoform X1 [Hylaeus volcanicus]|uniref:ubiquitin recognition factor in ER-associated degradation protein 1-like isoform X1 n=3 Tax=Hylaeus volcanicus TaxID=313075 RepID=UPI0023B7B4AC|nr:ubiquitin recognition factor in ER-associated degradation protein 1-like isoform X1 [Hylaeus volcanicus]